MSSAEMSRYVELLFEQIQQNDAQHKELLAQLADIKIELKTAIAEQQRLNAFVLSLTEQLHESRQSIVDRDRIIENLQFSVSVSNKHCFGSQ